MFGLIQLVKYEYSETSEGHANPGGLVALKATLRVMQAYPEDEAVQVSGDWCAGELCVWFICHISRHTFFFKTLFLAVFFLHSSISFISSSFPSFTQLNQGHALAVLASLSDNYAMRWVIFKEDWMGPTVVALNGNQVDG